MKRLLLLLTISFTFSSSAFAIDLVLGTGGFLGKYQAGLKYKNVAFIYGNTDGLNQFSLRYDRLFLKYFTIGAFVTYTNDSSYFLVNSGKYPTKNYYPESALRPGISFGLRYKYFYINTNITDTGLTFIFNEERYRNNFKFTNGRLWSTGLGVIIPL